MFDLETTGLSRDKDDIIEISAIKVRGNEVVDEFSTLINPGRPLSRAAMAVNHITEEMVATAPTLDEVLPGFLDFIGDDVLMGHNIERFDLPFVYRDCNALYGKVLGNDYVDTLALARLYVRGTTRHGLGVLADYYGIESGGAHRALFDCKMNKKVYDCICNDMGNVEVRTCPDCGKPLMKRKGKFGMFWGCSGYPNCRHTENA